MKRRDTPDFTTRNENQAANNKRPHYRINITLAQGSLLLVSLTTMTTV